MSRFRPVNLAAVTAHDHEETLSDRRRAVVTCAQLPVEQLLRAKFSITPDMSAVVKYADLVMLATERRDLDIDDGSLWPCIEGIPASDIIQIVPLRPGQAYGLFINRFNELTESRACLA